VFFFTVVVDVAVQRGARGGAAVHWLSLSRCNVAYVGYVGYVGAVRDGDHRVANKMKLVLMGEPPAVAA